MFCSIFFRPINHLSAGEGVANETGKGVANARRKQSNSAQPFSWALRPAAKTTPDYGKQSGVVFTERRKQLKNGCASFDVFADFLQIGIEACFVLAVDDVHQVFQFVTDFPDLTTHARIEKDFAQERVVFSEHSFGNGHVALKGGSGSVLMLHDGRKHEGGDEGGAQRIGNGFIVSIEGVLTDVKSQAAVEVLEEDAAHIVALRDDDGILVRQGAEVGKRRTEHGVGGDIAPATLLVKLAQPRLDRRDVAQDAVGGQIRHHLLENIKRVFQGHGVDDQFWFKFGDFLKRREALGVIHEAQSLWVDVVDSGGVFKTQQVHKERAHLARSQYQDFHIPFFGEKAAGEPTAPFPINFCSSLQFAGVRSLHE